MKAIRAFRIAMGRAEHLLDLYDVVSNTRVRKARADWSQKFTALMHWPKHEKIVRIDGRDTLSVLILRESLGVDADRFEHEYSSELLRASHVAAVSALDRYMHDAVVSHSWTLLRRKEAEIPKALAELPIPAVTTRKALERLRKSPTARPGSLVKAAIQDQLHKGYTFQGSGGLETAAKMLGITDFWTKASDELKGTVPKSGVIDRLNAIVVRRNQIVHEADLVRKTKAKVDTVRAIDRDETRAVIAFLTELVEAIDRVIDGEFAS